MRARRISQEEFIALHGRTAYRIFRYMIFYDDQLKEAYGGGDASLSHWWISTIMVPKLVFELANHQAHVEPRGKRGQSFEDRMKQAERQDPRLKDFEPVFVRVFSDGIPRGYYKGGITTDTAKALTDHYIGDTDPVWVDRLLHEARTMVCTLRMAVFASRIR